MMRKPYLYLGVILMMTFASSAESIPDPCKLLSVETIEEVMQLPMKEGRLRDSRSSYYGLTCSYFSHDRFEKSGNVSINIETTANMKKTDHIFPSCKEKYERQKYAVMEALKRQNKEDDLRSVEGLGDEAYWIGNALRILSKGTLLEIRVAGGFGLKAKDKDTVDKQLDEKHMSIAKEVAKRALEKLGSEHTAPKEASP